MADVQSSFIDTAAKAGIPYVVKLSGIMPELDSPFRFARMHGEIEDHLAASGMTFTNLRAGEFTTIRYVDVPPEAARQAQLNAGMPPYLADALAELFAERRAGKESRVSDRTPTLLGRPPTSFAEFAARNAATFLGKQPDRAAD